MRSGVLLRLPLNDPRFGRLAACCRGRQSDTTARRAPATCALPSPGSRSRGAGRRPSSNDCRPPRHGWYRRGCRNPRHTAAGADRRSTRPAGFRSVRESPAAWRGWRGRFLASPPAHQSPATRTGAAGQLGAPRTATPSHGRRLVPARAQVHAERRDRSPPGTARRPPSTTNPEARSRDPRSPGRDRPP